LAAGELTEVEQAALEPRVAARADALRELAVADCLLAEGTAAPMLMLKKGGYKYTCCPGDGAQLFDLAADPHECENLSGNPEYAGVESEFRVQADGHWDSEALRTAVVASQKRRRLTHDALQMGKVRSWDFQPYRDASRQYNRNLAGEMYDTDRRARIPYREPPDPDGDDERQR
jgi:choline-sulfatase